MIGKALANKPRRNRRAPQELKPVNDMADNKESRNKELVLKAFDALFNRRDYADAERYWSPQYIQHSVTSAGARGTVRTHQRAAADAQV